MKKTAKNKNNGNMKHKEYEFNTTRVNLKTKSDVLNFDAISERYVKPLSAFKNAQVELGILDKKTVELRENFVDQYGDILEKDVSELTNDEYKTLTTAQKHLDKMIEVINEKRTPHKKVINDAIKFVLNDVKVKCTADNTYSTLHDGYCLWVTGGKKGIMKDGMVELFKNMGIGTDKCNAGSPMVHAAITETFNAVGMQAISNKVLADNSEVQFKPWSKSTFNRRMMKHLIDLCEVNGVQL